MFNPEIEIKKDGDIYNITITIKEKRTECPICKYNTYREKYNTTKTIRKKATETITIKNIDRKRKPFLIKKITIIDYSKVNITYYYDILGCRKKHLIYYKEEIAMLREEKGLLNFLYQRLGKDKFIEIFNFKKPTNEIVEKLKDYINYVDKPFLIIKDLKEIRKGGSVTWEKRKIFTLSKDFSIRKFTLEYGRVKVNEY